MLKKFFKPLLLILLIFGIIFIVLLTLKFKNTPFSPQISSENFQDYSVSKNGWLCVNSTNLQNENKQNIQLKGLSSHGIQWYSDVITYDNLKQLKNNWGINIFRVAMYSEAYVSNPAELKQKLINIVDYCIDLDMYVIIDWHILNDSNPNTYFEQSNIFFNELSQKYANTPNVIYEICNEPNGNVVTWDDEIKPYAEKIINTIRINNPKSLIIVGTPDWCKKLKPVANNPLNYENIAYACHFYSGIHDKDLQSDIDYALNKNLCIFVSECGLTDATGDGNIYFDKFKEWIEFLNERNISWLFWSFSAKNESSSILSPEYSLALKDKKSSTNINNYLSATGKFIKNFFN